LHVQTDVVDGGAVSSVADPASSSAVQVPALPREVAADNHCITRTSVHPSVVGRWRRRTTDYYTHKKRSSVTAHTARVTIISVMAVEIRVNGRSRSLKIYDFLLVCHCNSRTILYHFQIIWRRRMLWPWRWRLTHGHWK